jgi:hypothetical protein
MSIGRLLLVVVQDRSAEQENSGEVGRSLRYLE